MATRTTTTTARPTACELCGQPTARRTTLALGNRAFPETPVCDTCDTCDGCRQVADHTLIENTHGTYLVHTCGCRGGEYITRH